MCDDDLVLVRVSTAQNTETAEQVTCAVQGIDRRC